MVDIEHDHSYHQPNSKATVARKEATPCFGIINKELGLGLTVLSEETVKLTGFNAAPDQVFFFDEDEGYIVSNYNNRVLEIGAEIGDEIQLSLANGRNNHKWKRKKCFNYHENYLISQANNGYMDVIENPEDKEEDSFSIGLFKNRAKPRTAIWKFNPLPCTDTKPSITRIRDEL